MSSNSTIGDESETERGGERRSTRTSGAFIHSFVPFRGRVIDFDFDFDRTIGRLEISERRRVNRAEGEVTVRVNRRTSSSDRADGANA